MPWWLIEGYHVIESLHVCVVPDRERVICGMASGPRKERGPSASKCLSVAVVVVVLPVRIPFAAGVLVMTPVPIGVANPTARTVTNSIPTIF
jgi:hypothetical protein